MATTPKQQKFLAAVAEALAEAVIECLDENGTPAGHVYMALMQYGCTLDQFNSLISELAAANLIERRGDVIYPVVE